MKKDKKPTMQETKKALADRFESQSLREQCQEILRYLNSAFPAQTIVPQARVDLLSRTIKREKALEDGS